MKKLLALALVVLFSVCASGVLAENYSSMTTEELSFMSNALNEELYARWEAVQETAEAKFTSADQFIYADNGSEVMVRGYFGTEVDIVIPAEINGLPVTRISESAFSENATICSVVIPDSVVEIGERAFYRCNNLQSVVMSKNVTEIKYSTFAYCQKLSSINLDHVSYFGEFSFDHTGLTGVLEFNAEHLTIESCAFQGVDGTTGIRINSKTCQINSSNAFHGHANLRWFYVSDHTQLNINGNFLYHCAKIEAFVAPATTTVSYNSDDLFVRCPNLIIYTPESSGLHAYAKKQFLRCVPEQYAEMSALLAVANQ